MNQAQHVSCERTIPVTLTGLKLALSRILTQPLVGRMIGWRYGGLIPFHGGVVDISGLEVPWRNVAALYWGLYESAEYRFVRDYLDPDLPTVELGSSLGAIASVISRRLLPGRRLICVEANPHLVKAVEGTLALNGPHLQSEILNAAVAYGCQSVRFAVDDDNLCSSVDAAADSEVVEVPAVTLRSLVERIGGGDYQLVADIEGAEAEILLHDSPSLSRCRTAILELHENHVVGRRVTHEDLVAQLRLCGFGSIVRYGPVVACRRAVSERSALTVGPAEV